MSLRFLRLFRVLTLAGALAPLAACTTYVLPDSDSDCDAPSTGAPATDG